MADRRSRGNMGHRGGGPGTDQRMSPMLIKALNHPVRREALRLLHETSEGRSAVQLTQFIDVAGTKVSYHLKVLSNLGAITRAGERTVRGVLEKFFVSAVADHRQVISILTDTESDDDPVRRHDRPSPLPHRTRV
jgi:DNA-binding transcriptional ArsR family regulator